MKRAALTLGLALLAPPAAAQWLGEPTWNAPTAGSGFTIYGDYSRPNTDAGGGNAIGGRIMLGAGTFTLTGGVSSWKADLVSQRITTFGGTAAFRLIGGSLIPVFSAVGLSVPLPTPVVRVEPYVSPGIRYHHYASVAPGAADHETNFGWVIGGNLGFGPIGVHLAYDSEKFADGKTHGVFGVGANIGLR
ncbi:MAG: hypothetical protein DMD42_10900 [Gemmatimonadetes bacterium]|nr:MAG: hypothetical protein DMD42_10900 [Gemmatimonadota bacterium]